MDFLNTLARAVQSAGTEFKKELFASTPPTAPLPQAMPTTTHATAAHATTTTATAKETTTQATHDTNPSSASVYLTQQQLHDYRNQLLSPRRVK